MLCSVDHKVVFCGPQGCILWTTRLCFVDHKVVFCGPQGCVLLTTRLCSVDHKVVFCGPQGCVLLTTRLCFVDQKVVFCRSQGFVLLITRLCTVDFDYTSSPQVYKECSSDSALTDRLTVQRSRGPVAGVLYCICYAISYLVLAITAFFQVLAHLTTVKIS